MDGVAVRRLVRRVRVRKVVRHPLIPGWRWTWQVRRPFYSPWRSAEQLPICAHFPVGARRDTPGPAFGTRAKRRAVETRDFLLGAVLAIAAPRGVRARRDRRARRRGRRRAADLAERAPAPRASVHHPHRRDDAERGAAGGRGDRDVPRALEPDDRRPARGSGGRQGAPQRVGRRDRQRAPQHRGQRQAHGQRAPPRSAQARAQASRTTATRFVVSSSKASSCNFACAVACA